MALVERLLAGEYRHRCILPLLTPPGKSQTLKSQRLRQPANRVGS